MSMKKALIIPDCHIPYHDRKAYELMLAVGMDQKPDEIVILGDFADMYGVNSHGKSPAVNETLQDEVLAVRKELTRLRRLFPKAKIVFLEGNHEYRLARYIASRCPDLYKVVEISSVLGLDKLGIHWVPYGPNQKYQVLGSKLIARHEPLAGGEHCAASTVKKALSSVIFGHTHRIQEAQVVDINGKNYRGISSGWLGDEKHPIFSYVKNHHQWAKGFSIVDVLEDGTWFNHLIHIIDHKVSFNGYLYEYV